MYSTTLNLTQPHVISKHQNCPVSKQKSWAATWYFLTLSHSPCCPPKCLWTYLSFSLHFLVLLPRILRSTNIQALLPEANICCLFLFPSLQYICSSFSRMNNIFPLMFILVKFSTYAHLCILTSDVISPYFVMTLWYNTTSEGHAVYSKIQIQQFPHKSPLVFTLSAYCNLPEMKNWVLHSKSRNGNTSKTSRS